MEIAALAQAFGPSGAMLALGLLALRGVLPWAKAYFDQQTATLAKLATTVEQLVEAQRASAVDLAELRRSSAEIALDVADLYRITRTEQPSRRRKLAAQHAQGNRNAPNP
ncbi:MAG: hypothetical protein IPO81_09470 [Kouleothrix sp.]|nr:hypothetical protein [Kouleothrix sp.]